MEVVEEWRERGAIHTLRGHDVFTLDVEAEDEQAPPALLLHGFPTCSFDWRHVLDGLRRHRRVVALDFLGFGLSAKPNQPYRMAEQADLAQSLVVALGLDEVDLVTHDMGDTIGGELLARELDGELPFTVRRRVLANGSIYIEQASLRIGQRLLLMLPDARLPFGLPRRMLDDGLTDVFSDAHPPSPEELDAQWALLHHAGGDRVMPRIIRYIRERQARQDRFTGAIERHPAPLRIVWGEQDPVAVVSMAHRLKAARPDADLVLFDRLGHFPMIEDPPAFAAAVTGWLDEA